MMKGVGPDGEVFIGLTDEEMVLLLAGEVRCAPAFTNDKGTAPAVRVMYAPTYEALRERFQANSRAPLPEIVDLRGVLSERR